MVRETRSLLATRVFKQLHRVVGIVRKVIRSFVLNASLAKPLGESGKLQLTTDMTEFEFALSAFMMQSGTQNRNSMRSDAIAEDYIALRALRYKIPVTTSSTAESSS